jgi:hypothetical protein
VLTFASVSPILNYVTADQFSAHIVCQSTGYSSMWCAQRTFPLTVAYRHWQDLKMGSDFSLITHVYLKGYQIAGGIAQSKPAVKPTESLLHKGHRGLLTSGCEPAGAWTWPLNLYIVEVRNKWNFTSTSPHSFMTYTGTTLPINIRQYFSSFVRSVGKRDEWQGDLKI